MDRQVGPWRALPPQWRRSPAACRRRPSAAQCPPPHPPPPTHPPPHPAPRAGTGKTLAARAVANRTDACFIRVIGSELVQKYVGEGARMVRELFQMARSKKACIVFIDEVDAVGGTRFDDGAGGDNEVQRTMLEIVNQLDGFDARGNVKILMATNRPDTLDPALLRPGRLDRKVEFGLPDLEGRAGIFQIHARSMNCERDIRFELLARLCPNTTGERPAPARPRLPPPPPVYPSSHQRRTELACLAPRTLAPRP
jgi:hypothetical protein